MDEMPPLPDLHQSEIDGLILQQLFADLQAHAQVVEIIPKLGPGHVAEEDAGLTLADAQRLLQGGSLRGLQVRYHYQSVLWWDTIMRLADGHYRVVRIRHDAVS